MDSNEVMDLIDDDGRTAVEVARECAADEQAMLGLLRALAALDLLVERETGVFAPSASGALLRAGHPDSVASFVRMFADPTMLRAWEHLGGSPVTTTSAGSRTWSTSVAETARCSRPFCVRTRHCAACYSTPPKDLPKPEKRWAARTSASVAPCGPATSSPPFPPGATSTCSRA